MLVQCDALIPTLLDALFLDPEHPRKDLDEALRAGIQCDGAECFLQLALFEPGKELLEQHPEALDALRALFDGGALTEEAGKHASGALAAVEGLAPPHDPTPSDGKHIMMSCESSTQNSAWTCRDLMCVFRPMGRAVDHQAVGCVATGSWLRGLVRCACFFKRLFLRVALTSAARHRPGVHEGVHCRRVSAPGSRCSGLESL